MNRAAGNLREYALGADALTWMHHAFAQGRYLGTALDARDNLESGKFSTTAPEDVEETSLSQFGLGKPFPSRALKEHLLATCIQFLANDSGSILLVEHALARASDPWIRKSGIPVTTCDDAVFLYATHDAPVSQISTCAWTIFAAYPPVLAVLGRLPSTAGDLKSGITKAVISEIALKAEVVLIGAYDGDGFLRWDQPDGRPNL